MFEMISEFIRFFYQIDSESMTILVVMVCWATLLVHIGVDSKMFTALFVPGMFVGGMLAFYVCRLAMITVSPSKDINAILISVVGIIGGFLATLLIIQTVHWIADLRRPLTLEDRN